MFKQFLVLENSSTINFHSLFRFICIKVKVIWEVIQDVEGFLEESDGCVLILDNLVCSSFTLGIMYYFEVDFDFIEKGLDS